MDHEWTIDPFGGGYKMGTGIMSEEGRIHFERMKKAWDEEKPVCSPPTQRPQRNDSKPRKKTMWSNYGMGPNAKLDRYKNK